MHFFTSESIEKHKEYLRQKKLKFSILRKSVPQIEGRSIVEIDRMQVAPDIKSEALELLYEINMHEIFFSSFYSDKAYCASERIRQIYKNEAEFLNRLYRAALETEYGFILAYVYKSRVRISKGSIKDLIRGYGGPMLAIDLCEHSYYPDYGFDKEKYLLTSLPYLKLNIFDREIEKQG